MVKLTSPISSSDALPGRSPPRHRPRLRRPVHLRRRPPGPRHRDCQAGEIRRPVGAARGGGDQPRRAAVQPSDHFRAERQADAAGVAVHARPRGDEAGRDRPRPHHQDDRPRRDSRPEERAGEDHRHRRAAGALRHAQGEVHRLARRAGAPREADHLGDLDQALHQSRRVRDGRVSRDPAPTSSRACRSAT